MFKRFSVLVLVAIMALVGTSTVVSAQDGKALFQANCAQCHNPLKDATGPALQGKSKEVPSKQWLYDWVHNSSKVIASGDPYANKIYNQYNKTQMTAFPQLSEKEIDAIITYVDNYQDPSKAAGAKGGAGASAEDNGGNTWLYAIITIGLAVLVAILVRVNKGLKKLSNEKEGIANQKDIPFYRNKLYIAIGGIIVFALAGFWIANGSINMGRQQNYMPKQPIFYSHKVHAGVNQIKCQYCHVGAEKGRQAIIPSTNICMNCHKQISEYTGDPLYTYEGKAVNGTDEIHKLYDYAGWNADKKQYNRDAQGNIKATPVEWVKIHNLPDHVYFNHSQHTIVGQVQCQTCHGPIETMDEVRQFAPLSMGWCINCHRETAVPFKDNNYYSIYTRYQEEIKSGKREKVTEADMGGTECQKCHY